MKLSRQTIVTEALALLNEEGFEAVSLRKLAARLDARAPSLARHVGDKASLLALMSHRVFNDALDTIPSGLRGKAWFVAYGRALRDKQRDTRDIAALMASATDDASLVEDIRQRLDAEMAAADLNGKRARIADYSIQALVTGWTSLTHLRDPAHLATSPPVDEAFEASLTALVEGFGFTD